MSEDDLRRLRADPDAWLAGLLLAAAPGLTLLLAWLYQRPDADAGARAWFDAWGFGAAIGASVLQAAGALALYRRPGLGRGLVTASLTLLAGAATPALMHAPGVALAVALGVTATGFWLWERSRSSGPRRRFDRLSFIAGARLGYTAVWGWAVLFELTDTHLKAGAVLAEIGLAHAVVAWWDWRGPPQRLRALATFAVLSGLAAWLAWPNRGLAFTAAMLLPLVVGFLAGSVGEAPGRRWWHAMLEHPARMLVATFAATGFVGTGLLVLPAASAMPGAIDALDAAFTAFSATCVTGLAVLDTPNDFTFTGQLVILLLIQVGGLGIMTFSTAAAALIGRRLSVRHEASVAELIGSEDRGSMFVSLRRVLQVTVVVEGAGALVLTALFLIEGDGFGQAVWRGLFTAISAFCNAGFALQSDSLVAYQQSPLVLHVIALIITVGSLGPAVVMALPDAARGRATLQVKLVVYSTAVLVVLPAVFFALAEWSNTLRGMSVGDAVTNAWFQSVTLRTAGFNSVDLAAVRPATLTMMICVMFIGGSPGSTAGGIKNTTAMLLLLAVLAALRGRDDADAFGHRISHRSIYKAAAVATAGLLAVVAALLAVQLTQPLPFREAAFEVTSALGTVGLSIGGTGHLDRVGKVLVILCMFAGRVGPLTLFLVLMRRERPTTLTRPLSEVPVG